MVSLQPAILTTDKEVFNTIAAKKGFSDLIFYRNFESIKSDEISVLMVDFDILEGESGQYILSKIRKKIHSKPVLLVVNEEKIEALDANWFFDDFIIYPFFSRDELSFRCEKLTSGVEAEDENIVSIGNLKIDLKSFSVFLKEDKLDFTYKEFELLRYLVQNRGKVFSRKELLSKIWGIEYIGGTRTVDVHVRRLRSKLGSEFTSVIETVRNVGYRCKE